MQIENWSLAKKTLTLVAIPVALQVALVAVAVGIWLHAEHLANVVGKAKDVSLQLQVFQKSMGDCVAACTIARATSGAIGLAQAHGQMRKMVRDYKKLRSMAANNVETSKEWKQLDKSVEGLTYGFHLALGETDEGTVGAAVIKDKGLKDFRVFVDAVQAVGALESRSIDPAVQEANELNGQLRLIFLSLVGGSALLAVLLVGIYRKTIAMRLQNVMNTTALMAQRKPLAAPVAGSDEIGLLDRQLHEIDKKIADAMHNEKLVIANAADIVCTVDSSFMVRSINQKALLNITGRTPEQVTNNSILNLVCAEDTNAATARLSDAVNSGMPQFFNCQLLNDSGASVPACWSVYWSAVDQTIFCVIRDARHERLIESLRQQFLASMHEELHIPLARVRESLAKLTSGEEEEPLAKRSQDELTRAQQSVTRLLGLVEDLLEVEQMSSENITVTPASNELRDIVDDSINALSAQARANEIKLQSAIPANLSVWCDKEKITRVLVNFLSNAIKYSPSNSEVSIFSEIQDGFIVLSVKDQGPGIPTEYQSRIFEAFEQVPGRSTKRGASSGLGLSICRAIVRAHGGEVGVESKPPEGSRFWLSLPAAQLEA